MDNKRVDILDSGYVQLIESWGSDERIIEAARMSTAKGFLGWEAERIYQCTGKKCVYSTVVHGAYADPGKLKPVCPHMPENCEMAGQPMREVASHPGDMKLLRRLWTDGHHTPFEMAGFTIEVQLPIFVCREWHRHRTQGYNEQSARYVEMPELAYIPPINRLLNAGQSLVNKQAGDAQLTIGVAENSQFVIEEAYKVAYACYKALIAQGVAREVARVVLPVGQYTRMRATCDLRNWLHFLKLRMDQGAQWEIRQYAGVVADIVKDKFPHTWELFAEGLG